MDAEGTILDSGCTGLGINLAGYVIHSALHSGRADVQCVMHCHSSAGVAVASQREGFLSLTQNSAIVGNVSYHDYEGIAVQLEERERLVKDLGDNDILILRNHGVLTCGTTIAQAFFNMYMLNRSCEMQVGALSGGREGLLFPDPKAQAFAEQTAANFNPEGVGQKEFAALVRFLDSLDPSYKY